MGLPLVTVVMPNYNGRRYVGQAIESVLKQTYKNLELIVVDDKSTDRSSELVEEYCKADKRVHLILSDKNHGVSIARNTGIARARGEYIALIDNDDLWEPEKIERQIKLAEAGADIVYCSYDFFDEDDPSIKKTFIVPQRTNFKKMLSSNVISCSSCLLRTDLIRKHPFRADYFHEDYLLWMELLALNCSAVGDQKVLMHYRQVSGSRNCKKGNSAKERWIIYRKVLGLSIITSTWAFSRYAINGVIKYYL